MSSNVELELSSSPLSRGFTVPIAIIRAFFVIVQFFVSVAQTLFAKILRILELFQKNWQYFLFIVLPIMLISTLFIEFQSEVTTIINIIWSFIYLILDIIFRNLLLPYRIYVEFLLTRWNDFWLFIFSCVGDLFDEILAIQNLFSFGGIVEAIVALIDFVGNCIFKVFQDICSWRIPFVAGFFQNILNIVPCFLNIIKTFILLIAYTIESIISESFSFVDFLTICNEFIVNARFCINNILEVVTFEALLGGILEFIAENPITISLPQVNTAGEIIGQTVFGTASIFPPGLDYDTTLIPIIVNGLQAVLICYTQFLKELFVGLFTGTIIANNDYVCPRLQFCEAPDNSFPWYVPPFFVETGAYEVFDIKYRLSRQLFEDNCLLLVPNNMYSDQAFPIKKIPATTPTSTILAANIEENILVSKQQAIDNCNLYDEVKLFPTNVTISCSNVNANFLAGKTAVLNIRHVSATTPGVATDIISNSSICRFIYRDPNNPLSVGAVLVPKEEQFISFRNNLPQASTFIVTTQSIKSIDLNQKVVRCDVSNNFVIRLLECVFLIIRLAIEAFISLSNTFAKLGGDPSGLADAGEVTTILDQFQELLFANPSREFCKVGLGNLISFKPFIYAIIRSTGCDNNSAEITDLIIEDLINDGIFGCSLSIVNIFVDPDFASISDFILNFILPEVLGEDLTGFILLIERFAICGTDPQVESCLDNFGRLILGANELNPPCGSCNAIAASFNDNIGIDTSTSGLAGVVNEWIRCIKRPPVSELLQNAINTFDPLLDVFVSFGSDFLDPLVCPFVVFESCLDFIANDSCFKNGNFQNPLGINNNIGNGNEFCCPIDRQSPNNDNTIRDLKCAKIAFCCILGADMSKGSSVIAISDLEPGAITSGVDIREIDFPGALWLAWLGELIKGIIDIVLFLIDLFDRIGAFFVSFGDIYNDPTECFEAISFGFTTIISNIGEIFGCISNIIDLSPVEAAANDLANINVPQFDYETRKRSVNYVEYVPYILPTFNMEACQFKSSNVTKEQEEYQKVVNIMLKMEHDILTNENVDPSQMYNTYEFEQTFEDYFSKNNITLNENESAIDKYYQMKHSACEKHAQTRYLNDTSQRMHMFSSTLFDDCQCGTDKLNFEEYILFNPNVSFDLFKDCQCKFNVIDENGEIVEKQIDLKDTLATLLMKYLREELLKNEYVPSEGVCVDIFTDKRYLKNDFKLKGTEYIEYLWCAVGIKAGLALNRYDSSKYPKDAFIRDLTTLIGTIGNLIIDFIEKGPAQFYKDFLSSNNFDTTHIVQSRIQKRSVVKPSVDYNNDQSYFAMFAETLFTRFKNSVLRASFNSNVDIEKETIDFFNKFSNKNEKRSITTDKPSTYMLEYNYDNMHEHYYFQNFVLANATKFKHWSRKANKNIKSTIGTLRQNLKNIVSNKYADSIIEFSKKQSDIKHQKRSLAQTKFVTLSSKDSTILYQTTDSIGKIYKGHLTHDENDMYVSDFIDHMKAHNELLPHIDNIYFHHYSKKYTQVGFNGNHTNYINKLKDYQTKKRSNVKWDIAKNAYDNLDIRKKQLYELKSKSVYEIITEAYDYYKKITEQKPVDLNAKIRFENVTINHVDNYMKKYRKRNVYETNSTFHERQANKTVEENASYLKELLDHIKFEYENKNMEKHMSVLSKRWDFIVSYFNLHKTQVYKTFEAAKHGVKNENINSLKQWISGEKEYIRGLGFVNASMVPAIKTLRKRQFKMDYDEEIGPEKRYKIIDYFRGNLDLRKKKYFVFGSERLGNWAHKRRANRNHGNHAKFLAEYYEQNPSARKRTETVENINNIIHEHMKQRNRSSDHINAHYNYAININKQQKALKNLIKKSNLTISEDLQIEYDVLIYCKHLVSYKNIEPKDLFNYNRTTNMNLTLEKCHHAIDSIDVLVSTTHGSLNVSIDEEFYFNHPKIEIEEFERMHQEKGHEHLHEIIRNKTLHVLKKREGKHMLVKRNIESMYQHYQLHEPNKKLQKRSLEILTNAAGIALSILNFIFVGGTRILFEIINCLIRVFTPFTFQLTTPTSIENSIELLQDSIDLKIDSLNDLADNPGDWLQDQIDGLSDSLICEIPIDIDGTRPYKLVCLLSLLLPETILGGIIEPPPFTFLPKDLPWPSCIETRTKNIRICDEGVEGEIIVNNDRLNACTRNNTIIDANGTIVDLGNCLKCDDPLDDDDDELQTKCNDSLPFYNREVKLFTLFRPIQGLIQGNDTFISFDPNLNCDILFDDNSQPIERPFCPVIDYTPGMYQSCKDDYGWDTWEDAWLYWLAVTPSNINKAFHSSNPLPLFLLVVPLPFTFYFPDIFVFSYALNFVLTVVENLRLVQLFGDLVNIVPVLGAFVKWLINLPVIIFFFRHWLFLLIPWFLSLCFEFPMIPENKLIQFACDLFLSLAKSNFICFIGADEFFMNLGERSSEYKIMDCPDQFCYVWTFGLWITGFFLIVAFFIILRLILLFLWEFTKVFFNQLYPIYVNARNRLQLVDSFNRGLRTETLARENLIKNRRSEQQTIRINRLLNRLLDRNQSVLNGDTTDNTSFVGEEFDNDYENNDKNQSQKKIKILNSNDEHTFIDDDEGVLPSNEDLDRLREEHEQMIIKGHPIFKRYKKDGWIKYILKSPKRIAKQFGYDWSKKKKNK